MAMKRILELSALAGLFILSAGLAHAAGSNVPTRLAQGYDGGYYGDRYRDAPPGYGYDRHSDNGWQRDRGYDRGFERSQSDYLRWREQYGGDPRYGGSYNGYLRWQDDQRRQYERHKLDLEKERLRAQKEELKHRRRKEIEYEKKLIKKQRKLGIH